MRSQSCTTLFPPKLLPAAIGYFKAAIARCDGRIGTGFIGTPALLPALTKIGEHELAASLFLQEEAPGWLYQVKTGATTIWERWDAIQPDGSTHPSGMNSYNHYAYGAVCQWLFESVAGFRPDPKSAGLQKHHLRADDHSGARRRSRQVMIPQPAASRRPGRSTATA